jgi:hypothetical protein
VRVLVCNTCPDKQYPWQHRSWRYPCEDCADGFVAYHEAAFPGHVVKTIARDENVWEAMQENLRRLA